MPDLRTILILGLGEGGGYLAQALAEGGGRLLAYDAAIDRPGAADGLRRRAAELGVELQPELGAWCGEVDLVCSLVPGTVAVPAAAALAPRLSAGAIFADLNSITADMMREVAGQFDGTGVRVVDGAVLGNFRAGGRVPLLLTGEGSDSLAALLPPSHFAAEAIEGRVGDASAIKMLRSVLLKGLEALFVECLVAAEVQGLRTPLMTAFRDLDERPFTKTMEVQTVTHLVHAARRLKEVERVAQVLAADGVAGTMTEATRRLFAETVAAEVAPADGEPLSLDDTLEVLVGIYRRAEAAAS